MNTNTLEHDQVRDRYGKIARTEGLGCGCGPSCGDDGALDEIKLANTHAELLGYANVEFRLGEIEALPVPDRTPDLIISNCVINLSPDKPRVYAEAFRALKPGGSCCG